MQYDAFCLDKLYAFWYQRCLDYKLFTIIDLYISEQRVALDRLHICQFKEGNSPIAVSLKQAQEKIIARIQRDFYHAFEIPLSSITHFIASSPLCINRPELNSSTSKQGVFQIEILDSQKTTEQILISNSQPSFKKSCSGSAKINQK